MLLLVVGLAVLVLVIVVVVFLSVRSMRADDDGEYPARPARRQSSSREPAGRGSARPDRAQPDRAQRRGADTSRSRAAAQDHPSSDYQTAALPRARGAQRGHQGIDGGRGDAPSRRARQPSRAAAGRNRSGGGDWSDTDWGGVSDEQYWAEMSSDKPLSTTARSAQPGSDAAREDMGERGGTFGETTRATAGAAMSTAGLGRQRGAGNLSERAEQPELAGEPGGFGAGSFRDEGSYDAYDGAGGYRDNSPAPASRLDNSTDPALAGAGGWPGADNTRTAAWSTDEAARWGTGEHPARDTWDRQDQPAPAWDAPDQPTPAWDTQDAQAWDRPDQPTPAWDAPDQPAPAWDAPDQPSPAWDTQDPQAWDSRHEQAPAPGGWAAEDPLTSPSFASQDAYGTDSRSYRGSQDRAADLRGHAVDPYDGGYASQASQNGYEAQHNGYPAHQDGYGADSGYPSGGLEPLPDLAGSATGPRDAWHAAPVPTDSQRGYTEPVGQDWDQLGARYQDDPSYQDASSPYQNGREDQAPDYGYEQQPDYGHDSGYAYGQPQDHPGAVTQGWQEARAGYGHEAQAGYGHEAQASYGHEARAGYGEGAHASYGHEAQAGYGHEPQAGYGYDQQPGQDSGYGYEQQGYAAPATNEYGQIGYEQPPADDGYAEPGQYGRHGALGYSPEFDIGRRR